MSVHVVRSAVRLHAPMKTVRLGPDTRMQKQMEEQLRARYEQGLRDGEKRLNEQLLQQRGELLELQREVLNSLDGAMGQMKAECENALVELALEAARRLCGSLEITAPMIQTVLSEALAGLETGQQILVLLNPRDLDLLKTVNETGAGASFKHGRIEFKADPEITRGGCLVQTRFGTVDSRMETRFQALKHAVSE